MILGTGIDICDMRRIAAVLERYGDRFLNRCFTRDEQALALRRRDPAPTLARRWAAKEAGGKALGLGTGRQLAWREVEVVSLPSGKPELRLHGAAARALARALPVNHTAQIHVSLTDDPPYAQAFVIIDAVATERGS